MITVVGMGRHSGDLTLDGRDAIVSADVIVVKSAKTHVAKTIANIRNDAVYCDDLYDKATDFDQLNDAIIKRLESYKGAVAFCVVGEGSDDTTVQAMSNYRLVSGVSLASTVTGNYADGTQIFNAIALCNASYVLPLPTVVKCIDDKYVASQVQLKLLTAFDYDTPVVYTYGTNIKNITLQDLLKQRFGYQSTLYIMPRELTTKHTFGYYDAVTVLRILRSENGCPWDKEQTHETITSNVIEEAYELANAINNGDIDNMVEELGDLLMQVLFHIGIAQDDGEFAEQDVYTTLCSKLINRHPHVFGDVVADNSDKALASWDKVKEKEHKIATVSDNVRDVPVTLSALMRAYKVQKRASKGGYEFGSVDEIMGKIAEETQELLNADEENKLMEGGDLLFAVVNLLRYCKVEPEVALMKSTDKFTRRVLYVEKLLDERGQKLVDLSMQQFDQLWNEAKKNVG